MNNPSGHPSDTQTQSNGSHLRHRPSYKYYTPIEIDGQQPQPHELDLAVSRHILADTTMALQLVSESGIISDLPPAATASVSSRDPFVFKRPITPPLRRRNKK